MPGGLFRLWLRPSITTVPINGTTDGWTINGGFVVSDTFSTQHRHSHRPGVRRVGVPGDVLQTAEVSITSSEFGGTTYTDQVVHFTESGCSGNQYGYNVCTETGTFGRRSTWLAGTYWLNLRTLVAGLATRSTGTRTPVRRWLRRTQ